jgi:hypothetical protein
MAGVQVIALADRVRMKLSTWRLKDRVHLLDMIELGLIDGGWVRRLEGELAERLQHPLTTRTSDMS